MKKLITPNEKLKELDNSFLKGETTIHQFRIKMMEYFTFLDQPLTKEMFEEGTAIFDNSVWELYSDIPGVCKSWSDGVFLICFVCIDGEDKITYYAEIDPIRSSQIVISTLHDLVELTKSKPLTLK